MDSRGFTIIEMLIVISVLSILLSIGVLNFSTYTKKAQIEKQVSEVHSIIMTARLSAIQRKQRSALLLGPNQIIYKNYSSPYENIFTGGSVVSTSNYVCEMKKKTGAGTLSDLNTTSDYVDFDTRGFTHNNITLVIFPVSYSGGRNCVIVQDVRTNIGRMENVSTCRIW